MLSKGWQATVRLVGAARGVPLLLLLLSTAAEASTRSVKELQSSTVRIYASDVRSYCIPTGGLCGASILRSSSYVDDGLLAESSAAELPSNCCGPDAVCVHLDSFGDMAQRCLLRWSLPEEPAESAFQEFLFDGELADSSLEDAKPSTPEEEPIAGPVKITADSECVRSWDDWSYRPRHVGKLGPLGVLGSFAKGYWKTGADLSACFEECVGTFDVIVWNRNLDDGCTCWSYEKGFFMESKWYADVVFDISACKPSAC